LDLRRSRIVYWERGDEMTDQRNAYPYPGMTGDDEGADLWLPNGTLFNDEAAEQYADLMMERARADLARELLGRSSSEQ
jgi:hypothetical protein